MKFNWGLHRGQSQELHVDEADGVPLFYVRTGQTPFALLTFGVGLADTTLPRHGWLHLLEHLAMSGRQSSRMETNASVGLWTTQFHVTGGREEVIAFLSGLCQWLSDPDLSALDNERRILDAEQLQRPTSDFADHLKLRYGPQGVGLLGYPELGLHKAARDDLSSMAKRVFVRSNASLAMNCSPPSGLALPLDDGPPPERATPELAMNYFPVHSTANSRFTSASGIVTDGPLSVLVADLVATELVQFLRHDERASYGTTTVMDRLNPEELQLQFISDVVPDRANDAVRLVHETVKRLAYAGVSEEALSDSQHRCLRHLSDDLTGIWQAEASATAALRGAPRASTKTYQARLQGARLTEVNSQLRAFADTMLITSPAGAASHANIPFRTGIPAYREPHQGRRFRATTAPADPSVLAITESICGIWAGDSGHAVSLTRPAAMLAYPDGARTVVSRHGAVVHVEPTQWRRGRAAVAELDRLIPEQVTIVMEQRTHEVIPSRTSSLAWVRKQLRFLLCGRRLLASIFVLGLCGSVLAAAVIAPTSGLAPLIAILAVAVIAGFRSR